MFTFLLEPLQYSFMVRGMAAAAMVGIVCAVVGSFVVLRGMAFFGDALAHAILPGVAVAYLIGGASGPLFWGALGAAVVTALGIGAITRGGRLREDTAIGVIFAGVFALGIALISTIRSYSVDLAHILFGNILAITNYDLLLIGGFSALVLLIIAAFYKEFVVISFDPVHAATLRLPAEPLRYLLLILVAVTVVVSLQTIGAGLMTAMIITPAATASLVARRLSRMMFIASLIGAGSGIVGLYLSYYVTIASGAAIVLVTTACFVGVWIAVTIRNRARAWPRET
ncbi:MAG TPA: metal ABC transporter permease [Anaerolineales bacterium]|nr:metal ABC transporter permease [Anaerolineales bacterium]